MADFNEDGPKIPLGHKANFNIVNTGTDVVTGLPATTAGPNASGNPVKPDDHPLAVKARQVNKTGEFAEKKPEESAGVKPTDTGKLKVAVAPEADNKPATDNKPPDNNTPPAPPPPPPPANS